eukprot:TRINITY_DN3458_c0_g1_i2.p1 TRINITY_DN3458_c0_g1~~TRINITY_DN3458_c0_g1_i2.p1  ORF type:complete len:737 (+),score=278.39 TRINITY_DN3458_c0_g1_i2:136-2346(+)
MSNERSRESPEEGRSTNGERNGGEIELSSEELRRRSRTGNSWNQDYANSVDQDKKKIPADGEASESESVYAKLSHNRGSEFEIKEIVVKEGKDDDEARRMVRKMPEPDTPMIIEFKDIKYEVHLEIPAPPKKGDTYTKGEIFRTNTIGARKIKLDKKILHGVSGKVVPGEFLAIMGPTGCGKTTLLGILARRTKKGVTGDLLVNGKPPTRDYKRRVAYVLQDDVLFAHLTVEQTLTYTARLRLPGNMTKEKIKERVSQLIDVLNLSKARNTIIGGGFIRGVSGGERKRVNIGLELLTNPSLVLLDEPTSGLDTSTAINLVKILKGMTDIGLTVISTIHQPSSQMFELFDKLLLLIDGCPIYYGVASRTIPYFISLGIEPKNYTNPADFVMNMILQEEMRKEDNVKKQLIAAFKERYEEKLKQELKDPEEEKEEKRVKEIESRLEEISHEERKKYPINWFGQFRVLFERSFFQAQGTYFDPINVAQTAFIAIIVGCFWFHLPLTSSHIGDRTGALFFAGLFSGGFYPLFQALFNFPAERAVLQRERAEGSYYLSAYFLAKVVSELPFIFLYPIIFISISYFMIQLRLSVGHFFIFVGITCCMTLVSSALGLLISALVPNQKKANVLATIAMLVSTLIGGFYIRVENIRPFVRWLRFFSFIKYGFDAYIINEFRGASFVNDGSLAFGTAPVIDGEVVVASFSPIVNIIWVNVLIVLGFWLIFMTSAFFALRLIYKQRG